MWSIKYNSVILVLLINCVKESLEVEDLKNEPGHKQPFGTGRPIHKIEEVYRFPNPEYFLKTYFKEQIPVKIIGGAKSTPAFHLWTDEYFLNKNIPKFHNKVRIETMKKESPSHETLTKSFKNFVEIYNSSTYYLVDFLPRYLAKDTILPFSLQCPDIIQSKLIENYMWFSSGDTSSLVHYDGVDNINCVYRGSKDFILVNPYQNNSMTLIDTPHGAFSSIDVDHMDYITFPSLAKIEYFTAHLEAGDCLYIPYKWLHQVRSFGSNIAVNVWFNHHEVRKTDLSKCNKRFNASVTLDQLFFPGLWKINENAELMESYLNDELSVVGDRMNLQTFIDILFPKPKRGDGQLIEHSEEVRRKIDDVWTRLDNNGDGVLTLDEIYNDITNIALNECYYIIQDIDELLLKEKTVRKAKVEL